jgi:hypothetical protein
MGATTTVPGDESLSQGARKSENLLIKLNLNRLRLSLQVYWSNIQDRRINFFKNYS